MRHVHKHTSIHREGWTDGWTDRQMDTESNAKNPQTSISLQSMLFSPEEKSFISNDNGHFHLIYYNLLQSIVLKFNSQFFASKDVRLDLLLTYFQNLIYYTSITFISIIFSDRQVCVPAYRSVHTSF